MEVCVRNYKIISCIFKDEATKYVYEDNESQVPCFQIKELQAIREGYHKFCRVGL